MKIEFFNRGFYLTPEDYLEESYLHREGFSGQNWTSHPFYRQLELEKSAKQTFSIVFYASEENENES